MKTLTQEEVMAQQSIRFTKRVRKFMELDAAYAVMDETTFWNAMLITVLMMHLGAIIVRVERQV